MSKIKQLRESMGLTQSQLAEKIGVDQTAVTHWEVGRYQPSLSSLIKLSSVFNIPLDELAKDIS